MRYDTFKSVRLRDDDAAWLAATSERHSLPESKPAADAMAETWRAGQQYARSKGYGNAELGQLEAFMAERGIVNRSDAMRVAPVQNDGHLSL